MVNVHRRRLLAGGLAMLGVPARARGQARYRVVIVGGGFGGATCARYLKLWNPQLNVTLIEPRSVYVACPMSNRLLGGTFELNTVARDYGALAHDSKVEVIGARVIGFDPGKRTVSLSTGATLGWNRLVLAPGIEFDEQRVPGLQAALNGGTVVHAWTGGPRQIWQLRNRISEMRQGGVVALHIPKVPFRCPPGPYERVSLIAHYLSRNNPKAKILLFDSNPDIVAKRDLFMSVWQSRYRVMIDYVPNAELIEVAPDGSSLRFRNDGIVRADVVNVVPPQRAPGWLRQTGLASPGSDWCPVDFRSYESTLVPGVHVLGDAIASAPGLPKSGHMANQSGKVCAAAIAALTSGLPVPAEPVIANTCYSFVSATEAMHVAGVYRYDAQARTMVAVKGAGGLSNAATAAEAVHAMGWAYNILYDTFGSTFTLQTLS